MNEIDPSHEYISHALYRESCKLVNGSYVKDLSILNRNLKDTIIIDVKKTKLFFIFFFCLNLELDCERIIIN